MTLADNGQFSQALLYHQKNLQLWRGNTIEVRYVSCVCCGTIRGVWALAKARIGANPRARIRFGITYSWSSPFSPMWLGVRLLVWHSSGAGECEGRLGGSDEGLQEGSQSG